MDWQPIESAPRDGMVLLYEDGAMRLAFWEDGQWTQPAVPVLVTEHGDRLTRREVAQRNPHETLALSDCLYEPTHWMPRPAPPTALKAQSPETAGE
jgi:hypothetical protein